VADRGRRRQPSRDNIAITTQIAVAGKPLGIIVHEQVVTGRQHHSSLKATGRI